MAASNGQNPTKLWMIIGIAAVVVVGVGGILSICLGAYNVAADAPHSRLVAWLMNETRLRSVAVRARNIQAPADLESPKRLAVGAGLYNEMCSGCHLAPGMERTEISQGLYPRAPELSHGLSRTPAQQFWTIKHGIKMTGMAAWGQTHNDTLIWDMVAFVRKLPTLSPDQYKALVKSAPEGHDEMMKMQGMDHDH